MALIAGGRVVRPMTPAAPVAGRKVGYDRDTAVMRITVGERVTRYAVEEFESDFDGRAFAAIKLNDDGEGVERYDVMIGSLRGEHDGCSCPDSTYRQRACRHYLAIKALLDAGRIG